MSLTAGPATNENNDTARLGDTITLPELQRALSRSSNRFWEAQSQLQDLFEELEAAALDTDATIGQLKARIERNRQRSERNRRPQSPANGHNHNGHQSDVRLVLTSNGLITECLRCGREVK
jgi:hypothetical protein